MSTSFDWPRYWLPRTHEEQVWSGPFLYDPEDKYGDVFSKDAKRLDQLRDKPVLILLGEPGSGKSIAVREVRIGAPNESRVVLDLLEYNSARDLRDALRNAAEAVTHGEIVLDGADESKIHTLGSTIGDWVGNECPPETRVRVAMRTSTLTPALEEQLVAGAQARGATLEIWLLAPLRDRDVQEAARVLGFDANAFWEEIHRVGAAHFAVLAGRLAAMAKAFRHNGRLEGSLWKQYEQEVRALVEGERGAVGYEHFRSSLGIDNAVCLLARFAAVSISANKPTFWVDRDYDAPSGTLRIGELVDPSEFEGWGDDFRANERDVEVELKIGPFRPGATSGEIVWAQRPIAEFLAAKYLLDRETPPTQVRQLIIDPTTGRIPPQLHGLAAMLCSKPCKASSDLIRVVADRDPHVALRGDLTNMTDEDRLFVAGRLVELALGNQLTYAEFREPGLVHRLKSPGLTDVLRPVLIDTEADEYARELAAEVAVRCNPETLKALAPDLASVALDANDALRVRIAAANALAKGDPGDRRRLIPILSRREDSDPDLDVRGCALCGLWEHRLIPFQEVLSALEPPGQEGHFGYYRGFLDRLIESVKDGDVPAMLNWATQLDPETLGREMSNLVNGLLARAYRLAESPDVRKALIPAMFRFREWRNRNAGWSWLKEDALSLDARFDLVVTLRGLADDKDWMIDSIVWGGQGIVRPSDFVPLLDIIIKDDYRRADALILAQGVGRYYSDDDREHLQAVYERRGQNKELDAIFEPWWSEYPIHGEDADAARKQYEQAIAHRRKMDDPVRNEEVPDARGECRRLLTEFEDGNRDAFWQLLEVMAFNDLGWRQGDTFFSDITTLPGWTGESEAFRTRVTAAATRYLAEGRDRPEEWIGQGTYLRSDLAGYRAVRLLRSEGRGPDADTYRRWAVALAVAPFFTTDKEHWHIVEAATQADKGLVEHALLAKIDADARAGRYWSLGDYVRGRLKDELGDRLMELAASWPDGAKLRLLEEGLQAGNAKALLFVGAELAAEADSEKTVSLVVLLASFGGDQEWREIRKRMECDETFGLSFVTAFSNRRIVWDSRQVPPIKVDLREWIYGWLEERFPTSEDDRPAGMYSPGTRHHIQNLRDAFLASLWNEGSPEAVAAVERLRGRFPEVNRLNDVLLHARLRELEERWRWPSPAELRALLRDPCRALVRHDADLQIAIIASLGRLNDHLRRTGMAWAIWNEGKEPEPKHEERFSDLVADWLRRDLERLAVLANREVQPKVRERWDILVEVASPHPTRRVHAAVVIEAKLAKNDDLWQSMEEQLLDTYMANSGLRHGVYLIGYVYGPKYKEPSRRSDRPFGIAAWRAHWEDRAIELSVDGRLIRSAVVDVSLPLSRTG